MRKYKINTCSMERETLNKKLDDIGKMNIKVINNKYEWDKHLIGHTIEVYKALITYNLSVTDCDYRYLCTPKSTEYINNILERFGGDRSQGYWFSEENISNREEKLKRILK